MFQIGGWRFQIGDAWNQSSGLKHFNNASHPKLPHSELTTSPMWEPRGTIDITDADAQGSQTTGVDQDGGSRAKLMQFGIANRQCGTSFSISVKNSPWLLILLMLMHRDVPDRRLAIP